MLQKNLKISEIYKNNLYEDIIFDNIYKRMRRKGFADFFPFIYKRRMV